MFEGSSVQRRLVPACQRGDLQLIAAASNWSEQRKDRGLGEGTDNGFQNSEPEKSHSVKKCYKHKSDPKDSGCQEIIVRG